MEKIIDSYTRYRLYVVGTLYLSACSVLLGYIAGMWGMTAMSVSASIMLVGGGVALFEFNRGRVSISKTTQKIEAVSNSQDEVINDIQQMRKYAEVANIDTNFGNVLKTTVKADISNSPQSENINYSDTVTEELIISAIERSSVDVYMQPIVSLPQRREVMVEVFARLRSGNGKSLTAPQYMSIAKAKNLQVRLDNLLLRQGLKALQKDIKFGVNRSYMLNVEANTLKDISFMNEIIEFLQANPTLSSKIIFEITQSVMMNMDKAAISVLKSLAKIGCGVSMDQVEDPHLDRDFLRDVGVRYIKVSCERLKDFSMSDAGIEMMRRIKQNLKDDDISIISDKIEDEKTLREILDLEIDYGQGYLFGKPDRESVYVSKTKRTA